MKKSVGGQSFDQKCAAKTDKDTGDGTRNGKNDHVVHDACRLHNKHGYKDLAQIVGHTAGDAYANGGKEPRVLENCHDGEAEHGARYAVGNSDSVATEDKGRQQQARKGNQCRVFDAATIQYI